MFLYRISMVKTLLYLLAERQAQQLGIDTDALKKELSLKSLDEQTMYVLKEFQKLDDTQKAAIEAVIKGFLQTKK